ncbi:MAG: glycine oxidase ThiO [Alphaproteobacteria bacterium]|nr:glycine oxidase ThiO [Alphaproteobacteria bacterium]
MKVTVIGAGVAGLACAVELAERGIAVEVVDQGEEIGAKSCSWYAGGMLAPWCEFENAEEPVLRLGREAIGWWARHCPGVVENGTLVVAQPRDVPDLDRFARRTEGYEQIGGNRIAELEPDLGGRFQRALFFSREAHLDPRAALTTLSQKLTEMKVAIRFGVETSLEEAEAEADWTIDCRGLAARDSLPDLRGVKGEMLLIRSHDVTLDRPVRMLHPRIPLYIVPRGDGLFMIGATMIESDERYRITARSMMELLGGAYALHPAFGEAEIVEIGTDVRPAFADNLPRIRRRGRVIHVNGLYRHGYLLAPALARMTAEAILDETHVPEMMDENQRERENA